MTTYNGYTNKLTWDFALWMQESGNWDELISYRWDDFTDNYSLSKYLEEIAQDMVGLSSPMGYNLRDSLLTTALRMIDYCQVAERILADR